MTQVEAYSGWQWGAPRAVAALGGAPPPLPANEPGLDHAAVSFITQLDMGNGMSALAQRALALGLDDACLTMVNLETRELHFTLRDLGAPGLAAIVTSGGAKIGLDWTTPYR